MKSSVLLALVSALAVTARPSFSSRAASPDVLLKNGQDAIALKYVSIKTYHEHHSRSDAPDLVATNSKHFRPVLPALLERTHVLIMGSRNALMENSSFSPVVQA